MAATPCRSWVMVQFLEEGIKARMVLVADGVALSPVYQKSLTYVIRTERYQGCIQRVDLRGSVPTAQQVQ